MRTVALNGTSHKYQFLGNADAGAFGDFIEKVCLASRVEAIAEEMSPEALLQKQASRSVCKKIADAAGLVHRYCDPNNEQRNALHIRDELDIKCGAIFHNWDQERVEREVRASHEIRERHWLNQLFILDVWPVLFVCGANHIDSFCGALETSGLHIVLVARNWAPGL